MPFCPGFFEYFSQKSHFPLVKSADLAYTFPVFSNVREVSPLVWILGGLILAGAFLLLLVNVVPPLETAHSDFAIETERFPCIE